jgi:spermidine synthase
MTAPYLLIPIAVILLMFYGISLLFNNLGIISRPAHRKIWNYLLLATFITTAVLGILMAIQVNYKMEVPWTEKVLKWHVNFGIAMSGVGMFHFLWHWGYYLPKLRVGGKRAPAGRPNGDNKDNIGWMPFAIGFIGIVFQTLIIRELLGLFHGNELMISLIFFIWLLLTGFGALTGSRLPDKKSDSAGTAARPGLLLIYLLIVPVILVPLLFYFKSLFFAPGIEAGPVSFAGFLFLILTPFCFLNGFAFTYTMNQLEASGIKPAKSYRRECLGAAAGGVTATVLVLVGWFSIPAARYFEKLAHPNEEIIATRSGAAGRITITRMADQVNIYENGTIAASSGNTMKNEQAAHFALLQNHSPKNILVIGGLISGIESELLKYPVERIDFVEPAAQLRNMAKGLGLLPAADSRIHLIQKDPLTWLHRNKGLYQVIVLLLPGPQNLSLNRFYSEDFFRLARSSLSDGGVLSVSFPGLANYISDEAINTLNPVAAAAKQSFADVQVFAGEDTYLLASDSDMKTDILNQMEILGIRATYLSPGYFDAKLFEQQSARANQLLDYLSKTNTNLRPVAFFAQISWWLGQYPVRLLWPGMGLISLILLLMLLTGKREDSIMFLMGAGSSGFTLMVLLLLQIISGSLYLMTGLLLAVFMVGLASGSQLMSPNRWFSLSSRPWLLLAGFSMVTGSLALLASIVADNRAGSILKTMVMIVLFFLSAWIIGRLFQALTSSTHTAGRAGKLYAADLMGSAIGAVLFPMVFLPLLGMVPTIAIISLFGIVSLALLLAKR